MKGIIFDIFIRLMEERSGILRTQKVLDSTELQSKGVYVSTGDYSHEELLKLVGQFCAAEGWAQSEVLQMLAQGVMDYFQEKHPYIISKYPDFHSFIGDLNAFIHPEVYRIHPGAELPLFRTLYEAPSRIILLYQSPRKMPEFAKAMILTSGKMFGVEPVVTYEMLEGEDESFVINITWEHRDE